MNQVEKIANRLKFIRKKKELGQEEFASALGTTQGNISNLEAQRRDLSIDFAILVCETFDVSIKWLLTGEEPIFNTTDSTLREPETKYSKKDKGIPLVSVEAIAGNGNGEMQVSLIDAEWYIIPEFKNKADFLIRVTGTSMSPKYYSGDMLACKMVPRETFIQWGKVYVMDTVQGLLCKRLYENPVDPNNVRAVSENKEIYPEFVLAKKDIRSLAVVVGLIRNE